MEVPSVSSDKGDVKSYGQPFNYRHFAPGGYYKLCNEPLVECRQPMWSSFIDLYIWRFANINCSKLLLTRMDRVMAMF